MREPRIYVDCDLQCGLTLALPAAASHYISRVLRMRGGQRIWLFNGLGGSYMGEIIAIGKRHVEVRLLMNSAANNESLLHITLVQGVSRAQHMDYTLQKAVELGVSRIVPVMTEFSNVKFEPERTEKKLLHWKKIVTSACEQCGRNLLPDVVAPIALAQWLAEDSKALKLLLHPGAGQHLSAQQVNDTSLSLYSGPEGGFSPAEVEQMTARGCVPVELGPRVLRTETAALAAISACQVLWGDMA